MAIVESTSTLISVTNATTMESVPGSVFHMSQLPNWTIFSCNWLDEIYNIQNGFYWRHNNSTYILALYVLVCTFGGLANLFVIVAFIKTTHLRNLRNYFIVNLAVSDLILCTVTAPVTLYLTLNLFWPFGNVACQIVASIQAVNLFVSCLTLVLIAMDRFLLTLCPVKWRLAAKAPICCYLIVWLLSLLVAAPYFFAVDAEPVTLFDPWNSPHSEHMLKICDRKRPQICIEKTWHRLPFSRRDYTLTVLAIQYILPLLSLAFAYSQIGSTIRRRIKSSTTIDHQRKQLVIKRNRKALLLLLMLVIIYAIAWLPMNAYNVLNVLDIIEFSQYRYIFCHLIGICSTCINPLLYALINDSFRSAFFVMLRPFLGPCTKYAPVVGNDRHLFATNRPPHMNIYGQTIVSTSSLMMNNNNNNNNSNSNAIVPIGNFTPIKVAVNTNNGNNKTIMKTTNDHLENEILLKKLNNNSTIINSTYVDNNRMIFENVPLIAVLENSKTNGNHDSTFSLQNTNF